MKPNEIVVNGIYSSGLGSTRKILAITNFDKGLIVKHELISSKISKKIGSVHQCKLTSFAAWAWERIE